MTTGFRLGDVLRGGEAARRGSVAMTQGSTVRTYDELDERSSRAAQALLAAGVRAGDRVPILAKNCIELFEVLFGALKMGAVLVPVNWRLTASETAAILADARGSSGSGGSTESGGSGGPVLVVGPELADLAATAAPGMRLVTIGPGYEAWLAAAPARDPLIPADDATVVLQLYTSGTTGKPKGVMLDNRNLSALAAAVERLGYGPDSVSLVAMPTFHIGGIGPGLLGLQAGGRTVVVADFEPVAVLDLLERERVTNAFLVPAALAMLAAVPGAADRDWSALESLSYGASPITAGSLRTVLETFKTPMMQVYGMTETTGAIVQLSAEDHDPHGPREYLLRSAGLPYEGVELRITDPVTGDELPRGEVGELLVRGDAVTPGYWGRPGETAAALTADGWLHTGDAGYVDGDGYLFLTDRIKDMIVSGAENIYPIEVESVLSEHPGVADIAVIGIPDERWGETVKAIVVARPGVVLDPEELLAWARGRLAGYKQPRSIDIVDALPRNPSGKILKKDLRAPYWAGVGRSIN